jgi:hypothetical protein
MSGRKPRKKVVNPVDEETDFDDFGEAMDEFDVQDDAGESENKDDKSTTEKRGPGRPRKNVPRVKLDRLGITSMPVNANAPEPNQHYYELMYENPMMFRKIFTLFKVYSVKDINMSFMEDRVFMYSITEDKKIKLCVEIFCERMNKYYCSEPLHVTLDTEYFYTIFQTVSKDYSKIVFVTTRESYNSRMWMIFVDEEGEESHYEIDINPAKENPLPAILDVLSYETEYPLSFELPFKYLKRKVVEYGNLKVDKIKIEQTVDDVGTRDLYLACETSNTRIKNKSPLKNAAKMGLISAYDGPLFSAPIYINSIKPLSSTLISDKIRICVDNQRDLICSSSLDYDMDAKSKSNIVNSFKCKIRVALELAKVI